MTLLTPEIERAIYEHTRALIESGWCQNDYAQDEAGNPLYVHSPPEPSYWSLGGALYLAVHLAGASRFYAVIENNLTALLGTREELEHFNDATTTTKKDVLALLDRAIAARAAEQKQQ